jgi:hypothetical protein
MPTERPPLVGEVVPTFADRGCCVVSPTDPPRSLVSVFLTGAATISSKKIIYKLKSIMNCDYKFYPAAVSTAGDLGHRFAATPFEQTVRPTQSCIIAHIKGLNTSLDKSEPMHCNSWVNKVKLSPCLTNHRAVKMHGRADIQLHEFSTSAADGSVSLKPRPLYPTG